MPQPSHGHGKDWTRTVRRLFRVSFDPSCLLQSYQELISETVLSNCTDPDGWSLEFGSPGCDYNLPQDSSLTKKIKTAFDQTSYGRAVRCIPVAE